MKYLKSILVWLCFIPAAILNGGFREYTLSKLFSEELATAISGITLSLFILIISRLLLPRIVTLTQKECYITGFIWMILTIVFEFTLGISEGISIDELVRAYNPTTGNLWVIVILTTFLAPRISSHTYRRVHKVSNEQDYIIELYRGDLWECQLIETILKDNGIDCFIRNNFRNGYGPIIAPAQQVQIMIKNSDLEKGAKVLEIYSKRQK